jgi:hypothetical protein
MQIRVFKCSTHLEVMARTRSVAQPEVFPLLELTAGTPSVPQTEAFTLLDTLTVFLRGTSLRKVLIEFDAPSRNLWLLEHIDIWNYAVAKGMKGTQIAYVVTAGTVDTELKFAANYACKRGIELNFFTARTGALSWLLEQRPLRASTRDTSAAAETESGVFDRRGAEFAMQV